MNYTTNLGLRKPETTDTYNIADHNYNSDKIDAAVKNLQDNTLDQSVLPLSVANGGTGSTAAPAMKVDLESSNAVSPYTATPRPGVEGVLPVEHGGTGNTSGVSPTAQKLANSRSIQVNLASGSAANFDGSSNISPGVTGILPPSRGGTGVEAMSIRTNLASEAAASVDGTAALTPGVSGVLPLGHGGTGGSNASAARSNLGLKNGALMTFSYSNGTLTITSS